MGLGWSSDGPLMAHDGDCLPLVASECMQICVIGQLLCLGNFPPSVKAFTFSWPGGRELTYFSAVGYARHPRCQADFAAFVASLIDAGVREFHVLCHSVCLDLT